MQHAFQHAAPCDDAWLETIMPPVLVFGNGNGNGNAEVRASVALSPRLERRWEEGYCHMTELISRDCNYGQKGN